MNLDAFVRAKRTANRRAKVLDIISSRWFTGIFSIPILRVLLEPIGEALWDRAFERYLKADTLANLLMADEIRRRGGTVFPTYARHLDREVS